MNLFNKSFFRFTMGFVGILIVSFLFTFVVSHLHEGKTAAVSDGASKDVTVEARQR